VVSTSSQQGTGKKALWTTRAEGGLMGGWGEVTADLLMVHDPEGRAKQFHGRRGHPKARHGGNTKIRMENDFIMWAVRRIRLCGKGRQATSLLAARCEIVLVWKWGGGL